MAWLETTVEAAPGSEPIDLDDAKRQCGVLEDDFDDLLESYIEGARGHIEDTTGLRICTQTVVMRTGSWADLAQLPTAPLQTVDGITYLDPDGVMQTLSGSVYQARLFGLRPAVVLVPGAAWPSIQSGSLISVTAVAGYADDAVPGALKDAVRYSVAQRFANREVNDPAFAETIDRLTFNHRVWR
ncbi:head-tail connector protein [Sphingobium sp. MI1205]|uniref:head-tail connector protein n=1 Tax=Sphingobium sp. MI1205 TaxID=407020 RepID=UPI00076FE460|nr:phage head-tail connector protein [Sphingobium sp. MI1205]AMK19336.1 hypothetical protein K663_14790 [Sphingobium sp. MI1205]